MAAGMEVPASVMLLDNVPHDWLFPRCAGVIHHGGAGTTAAGLLAVRPMPLRVDGGADVCVVHAMQSIAGQLWHLSGVVLLRRSRTCRVMRSRYLRTRQASKPYCCTAHA